MNLFAAAKEIQRQTNIFRDSSRTWALAWQQIRFKHGFLVIKSLYSVQCTPSPWLEYDPKADTLQARWVDFINLVSKKWILHPYQNFQMLVSFLLLSFGNLLHFLIIHESFSMWDCFPLFAESKVFCFPHIYTQCQWQCQCLKTHTSKRFSENKDAPYWWFLATNLK